MIYLSLTSLQMSFILLGLTTVLLCQPRQFLYLHPTSCFTLFADLYPYHLHCQPSYDDDLLKCAYIQNVALSFPAAHLHSSLKAIWRKVQGANIVSVNHDHFFTAVDVFV